MRHCVGRQTESKGICRDSFISRHPVGLAGDTTPTKNGKKNAGVGGALTPAQVPAQAHAQHTNARTYRLSIGTWDSLGRLHITRDASRTYTHAQLVRFIADKHAKGYRLVALIRWCDNSYSLAFDIKRWCEPYIGFAVNEEKAGRRMTKYAPVQEAHE